MRSEGVLAAFWRWTALRFAGCQEWFGACSSVGAVPAGQSRFVDDRDTSAPGAHQMISAGRHAECLAIADFAHLDHH
jgi:hypothetical protein